MDDEYAEIFKQYNIPIGSSLDGPKSMNDKQRGIGYYEKTLEGYEIAKKHGVYFHTDAVQAIRKYTDRCGNE